MAVGAALAETVQRGNLRVAFLGKINPTELPRGPSAPIAVSLGMKISTIDHGVPSQLQRIEIAINRHGHLDRTGLPTCRRDQVQPSTTAEALRACGRAKVGEGRFSADVVIPEQSPFPSRGKLIAFNGTEGGRPVILAHIYGTDPIPTSYTFPLRIRHDRGTFGTLLSGSLLNATARVAFVTHISLTLRRHYRYRGRVHSYLSAACPAAPGFPGAIFPLARASLHFAGGPTLSKVLTRTCRVKS